MSKSKIFLAGFIIVSLGELISVPLGWSLHYLFKPCILLLLMGYYLSSTNQRNATLVGALFFCWVGDSLLLFVDRSELYFMLGLVAFLIGHLCYIFAFNQLAWSQPSTLLPTQKVRYTFPIFLLGTGLIVILYPGLGALKIPVIIYATVLMIMVSSALLRMSRTTANSFGWVFIGATLFMISDSLLAINKFYASIPMAHICIMVTYIIAQYMIVTGLLAHPKK